MSNLIKQQISLESQAIYSCKPEVVPDYVNQVLDPYLKWTLPFSSMFSSARYFFPPLSNLPFLEEELGSSYSTVRCSWPVKFSPGLVSF